jgi:hypothetical protein
MSLRKHWCICLTSFSNSALDGSLFEVPAGFTRVQQNPDQVLKQNK